VSRFRPLIGHLTRVAPSASQRAVDEAVPNR